MINVSANEDSPDFNREAVYLIHILSAANLDVRCLTLQRDRRIPRCRRTYGTAKTHSVVRQLKTRHNFSYPTT